MDKRHVVKEAADIAFTAGLIVVGLSVILFFLFVFLVGLHTVFPGGEPICG